jgi:hypothetical protein
MVGNGKVGESSKWSLDYPNGPPQKKRLNGDSLHVNQIEPFNDKYCEWCMFKGLGWTLDTSSNPFQPPKPYI